MTNNDHLRTAITKLINLHRPGDGLPDYVVVDTILDIIHQKQLAVLDMVKGCGTWKENEFEDDYMYITGDELDQLKTQLTKEGEQ